MNPTTLFTVIGRHIKAIDNVKGFYTSLDSYEADIVAQHATSSALDTVGSVQDAYDLARSNNKSTITTLISTAGGLITDPELTLDPLYLPTSTGRAKALEQLFLDMENGAYYVSATTPSYTFSDPLEDDQGEVICYSTLDGVTSPRAGVSAFRGYSGETTQFTIDNEVINLTCTADSYSGGTSLDGETWQVQSVSSTPYYGADTGHGSGEGQTLQTLGATNLVDDTTSHFDSWSGTPSAPSGWTVVSGGEGIDYQEHTGANLFRGSSCLQIISGGSDTVTLTTTIAQSLLTPNKAYIFGLYLKTAGVDDTVTLVVREGAVAVKTLTINTVDDYSGNYVKLASTIVVLPADLSEDITLQLAVTPAGATFSADAYIDKVFFCPADYVGGMAMLIAPHLTGFYQDDDLRVTMSNDLTGGLGRFSRFFTNAFGFQLPTSGSNLLADTLITS